jgi:hypothetical protein
MGRVRLGPVIVPQRCAQRRESRELAKGFNEVGAWHDDVDLNRVIGVEQPARCAVSEFHGNLRAVTHRRTTLIIHDRHHPQASGPAPVWVLPPITIRDEERVRSAGHARQLISRHRVGHDDGPRSLRIGHDGKRGTTRPATTGFCAGVTSQGQNSTSQLTSFPANLWPVRISIANGLRGMQMGCTALQPPRKHSLNCVDAVPPAGFEPAAPTGV